MGDLEKLLAPEIMYVCEICAEHSPETCGHYYREDVRQSPTGKWICEDCYDAEWIEDGPAFSGLPIAPKASPQLAAALLVAERALRKIAAFDDVGASEVADLTGSYGCFDEPASVQVSRAALSEIRDLTGGGK